MQESHRDVADGSHAVLVAGRLPADLVSATTY